MTEEKTTHAYGLVLRIKVPDGIDQADLDRAVEAAVKYSSAGEALEEALSGSSIGKSSPTVTLERGYP